MQKEIKISFGNKINNLLILSEYKIKYYEYYKCLCDCGNYHSALKSNILSGKTKSCGCLRKGIAQNRPEYKIKQSKIAIEKGYGKWMIGKKHKEESKIKIGINSNKNKKILRGWKHSLQSRINISNGKKGNKCHLWKGGITNENILIRQGIEYREWRTKVFERDNYTCQHCFKIGGKLNAHHIVKFSENKELRFDINNGITLCINCHKKEHFKMC